MMNNNKCWLWATFSLSVVTLIVLLAISPADSNALRRRKRGIKQAQYVGDKVDTKDYDVKQSQIADPQQQRGDVEQMQYVGDPDYAEQGSGMDSLTKMKAKAFKTLSSIVNSNGKSLESSKNTKPKHDLLSGLGGKGKKKGNKNRYLRITIFYYILHIFCSNRTLLCGFYRLKLLKLPKLPNAI